MAEFYVYTRFQNDRIYVGAPTERYAVLRRATLLPVTAMLDVNGRSPYYHDADKIQIFYAESWALIHFMTLGPGMDSGKKLNAFFEAVQDRVDQQTAFREYFGDQQAFDKSFAAYVRQFTFTAGVLPPDHTKTQRLTRNAS